MDKMCGIVHFSFAMFDMIFDSGVEIKDYGLNASGKLSLILKGKIRSDFHLGDIFTARLS